MTKKRFEYIEYKGADYILDTPNTELDFIEMLGDALETEEIVDKLNELSQLNYNLTENAKEYQKIARIVDKQNKQLEKENKELKKQIEDLYENDKSLRKMMSGMSLNYQGVTVHRALYSEVLKILEENGADDLCSDLKKTSIDTSINGY